MEQESDLFSLITTTSPEAIFICVDGKFRYLNPAAQRLFGTTGDEELIGCSLLDYTHPDDRASEARWIRHARDRRETAPPLERKYIRCDGTPISVEAAAAPFRYHGEDGRLVFLRDITQRKQAEATLRASEERFRLAREAAQLGIFDYDARRRTSHWDEKTRELFGVRADTAITFDFILSLIPEEDSEAARAAVRRALDPAGDGRYRTEYRLVRGAQDPVRWLAATGQAVFDNGRATRIVGVVQDITDQKSAAQRDAQYRAVVETSTDGFWVVDDEGHILSVNTTYAKRSGYSREQLLRMRITDFELDASPEAVRDRIDAVKREGSARFEGRHRTRDGRSWPVEVSATYWTEAGGRIFCFLRDITERKQARRKILELNTNLERRVAERTAELEAANAELDAFAGTVSHDLRGPLRAISGFTQALAEDCGEQIAAEGQDYLERILAAAGRMDTMIDGLLALARDTRGELRRDKVDISELVRHLADEFTRQNPDRTVRLEVQEGIKISADARLMEVALRNLLGNAWKYTAATEAPIVRVYTERQGGRKWICIADNGPGFSETHAGKLFQPFQRLHDSQQFPGLGIGLATVQRIVRRHGGRVAANAKPGKGAVFRIHLPSALGRHSRRAGGPGLS